MEIMTQTLAYHTDVEKVFQEIVTVIKDGFVATYQTENNALIMRIVNGQKFRITVEEV